MMGIHKICNTSIFIYTYKFLGPDLARAKKAVQFHHTAAPIKACVHYFYQIFIFSPNDSPSKTMKNAFYFIKKALFVLEIIKFFCFRPSLFLPAAITLDDELSKYKLSNTFCLISCEGKKVWHWNFVHK